MIAMPIDRDWSFGYDANMSIDIYTSQQAAGIVGVSQRTIIRVAARAGIGSRLGASRQHVFTADDIDRLSALCRRRPGNPNFSDPRIQREFATRKRRNRRKS